jgi:Tfp pilus assembly protein FimT
MKKTNGLTLIELTIAMAVLMVVVGTVLIGTRGNNNDYRALHNAALVIQADMRYAQRRAVMEGRRVHVIFRPSSNSYQIYKRRPYIYIIRTVYLENGVNLVGTSFPGTPHRINYLPRGTASAAGTITLSRGRYLQDITTTVSGGRVEIKPITIAGGN